MKVYFLRHGEADWPHWDQPDDDRPLTKNGRKEARQVVKFLHELKVRPDAILSSPLPRAYETAALAAKQLKRAVTVEKALGKGFEVQKFWKLLQKNPGDELLLVGHEPNFSEVLQALTGARIKIAKAGVACVDLDGEAGTLVWLFPPKMAKV